MRTELPTVEVLRLRALEGYQLWLRFTDGSEGVRDLFVVIAKGGAMVEPLKSKEYFDRIREGRVDLAERLRP